MDIRISNIKQLIITVSIINIFLLGLNLCLDNKFDNRVNSADFIDSYNLENQSLVSEILKHGYLRESARQYQKKSSQLFFKSQTIRTKDINQQDLLAFDDALRNIMQDLESNNPKWVDFSSEIILLNTYKNQDLRLYRNCLQQAINKTFKSILNVCNNSRCSFNQVRIEPFQNSLEPNGKFYLGEEMREIPFDMYSKNQLVSQHSHAALFHRSTSDNGSVQIQLVDINGKIHHTLDFEIF